MVLATADAAVVLIKETGKALSIKTDCNGRYVYLNPKLGAMIAVAESARNVVCTGATPLAITNCLNFGNPYKPEVYWQFKEAVAGIGEACRALDTPVTGGNVSFYNESPNASVFPTPVIGMLGLIEDVSTVTTGNFKVQGDAIVLLGVTAGHLGGSEFLSHWHKRTAGQVPTLDLGQEKAVQDCCLALIRARLVRSAHDCSDGGLAVALAESCIAAGPEKLIGARVALPWPGMRPEAALFGEDQSRIVVSVPAESLERVLDLARQRNVQAEVIGSVGGDRLIIAGQVDISVGEMADIYYGALEERVER